MSEYSAYNTTGKGLGDEVLYYRRPFLTRDGGPAENAGWITWADSLSGTKLRDYEVRGFTPLRKYGYVNSEDRLNELITRARREGWQPRQFQAEYTWGPILRHPDGPAEFPLEQILALRWYEPQHCPVKDVQPAALFPQLRGHRVKHHGCPQCNRNFAEVDGAGAAKPLANHLRIMHDWDIQNILAFGKEIGIDFAHVEYGRRADKEFDFGGGEDEAEGETCQECGRAFTGRMAKAHLAKHISSSHAVFEMETV